MPTIFLRPRGRYSQLSTLNFLLLVLLLATRALAAPPQPIGPGTTHQNLYQPAGPWAIHILTADLADKHLRLESLLGDGGQLMGKSGVSGMLAKSTFDSHHPIAGVNGDYFAVTGGKYLTIPLGFHVQNGELVTLPMPYRSVFYLAADGRAGIGRFYGSAWLRGPDNVAYPIAVMNRAPNAAQAALFTSRFGAETRAAPTSTQVTLDSISGKFLPNAELTARVVSMTTGDRTFIPPTGAVVAGNGIAGWALSKLKVGDEVTLQLRVEPNVGDLSAGRWRRATPPARRGGFRRMPGRAVSRKLRLSPPPAHRFGDQGQ